MFKKIQQYWHCFFWGLGRVAVNMLTVRGRYYFVVDGILYLVDTEGSTLPYEWKWTEVRYL